MEFLGAVLAGARVSGTIKNDIVDIEIFRDDPGMLLLAMVCAVAGSSVSGRSDSFFESIKIANDD